MLIKQIFFALLKKTAINKLYKLFNNTVSLKDLEIKTIENCTKSKYLTIFFIHFGFHFVLVLILLTESHFS